MPVKTISQEELDNYKQIYKDIEERYLIGKIVRVTSEMPAPIIVKQGFVDRAYSQLATLVSILNST